jgi:hypothetical protein
MSNRLRVALYCSLLVLTGCSGKKEPSGDVPAGLKRITLHVKDMWERLDLT